MTTGVPYPQSMTRNDVLSIEITNLGNYTCNFSGYMTFNMMLFLRHIRSAAGLCSDITSLHT